MIFPPEDDTAPIAQPVAAERPTGSPAEDPTGSPAEDPTGSPAEDPTGSPAAGAAADPGTFLGSLFRAMVAAADPARLLPGLLPPPPRGQTIVVGAGKAAAAMAQAVEECLGGTRQWSRRSTDSLSGIVATRYGHAAPCRAIEALEAGHPLPDSAGAKAARRIMSLVTGLTPEDLVIVLLSGGGSALLTLPAPGLTLHDLRRTGELLLRSGAPIGEINCVRKHLSAIAGGRLAAAAWPARVVTYAISDVPGDDPAVIASGPTVADPTTFAQALAIVHRYRLELPEAVRAHLEAGRDETPKPGDLRLSRSRFVLLATPATALTAAASAAKAVGVEPAVLGPEVQGEARVVAAKHGALVRSLAAGAAGSPSRKPVLVLSGGETTVTVSGNGRGGRNTEYLLALALALEAGASETGPLPVHALAADTDGIDGTEDNAGAFLRPDTLARARAAGIDPVETLDRNDSYSLFAALGDLLVTGPTRTNVNDFRAIFVR
jgi:glycerate 2-kinase